ncbi:MAG TPA: hypothetical protein VHP33_24015 [Polyangiaceae bacterium]|nr:hypothetical protein [Polyangiaceae bacterium]
MIKRMLGCGATFSMLTLAACGGSVQEIGDAAAGSGGSATEHAGSGSTQPHAGNATGVAGSAPTHAGGTGSNGSDENGHGGAAWASGTCDPPCGEGFGCYTIAGDPAGLCAPLCDTPEQGQTPDADLSCSNSVLGGAGQCVFSLGFGWPAPGGVNSPPGIDRVVTGLCSNACDPLAQDCPSGFKCDQTATYSAFNQQGLYACMPNKDPRALGEACDSTGDGQCDAGLTCAIPDDGPFEDAKCVALCDMRDASTCPTDKTCTENVVTLQDNDPNIGVCL